ncbi:unnamed protein product [Paramecium primaurelia]|uniref:Uncharacterized protein n=1 Tax=Paramecium primaurelia TaxID=5886 RepID=A0A8S1Q5K8_PARPR|nr:unnamed protein product [Paramecium primaurelia]
MDKQLAFEPKLYLNKIQIPIYQQMNYFDNINQSSLKNQTQKQDSLEIDGFDWDYSNYVNRKIRTKLLISHTNEQDLKYIQNGSILRIEKIQSTYQKPELIKNLEQVKHLQWIGEYGKNNLKVGNWKVFWKGENLVDVGGQYSTNGKKQGKWKETIQNYWTKNQVYFLGEYENDQRQGVWRYIYDGKYIGGGEYNLNGEKIGIWEELSEAFWDFNQIIYIGKYQRGKKIGRWKNSLINGNDLETNQQIWGGEYDEEGTGIKSGKWIEISQMFEKLSQVIDIGEYKNGQKSGIWNYFYRDDYKKQFEQIGGGSYDEQNLGIKNGLWIELSDGFEKQSQVIHKGIYTNGKKFGKWEILYRANGMEQFQKIGGGLYDLQGEGVKNGFWIELSEDFTYYSQVTYCGEYKKDKKVGRWDIWFNNGSNQKIGGGQYLQINGMKIGKWIELSDGFYNESQVILNGDYKNGKKVGIWNIYYRQRNVDFFKQIGCGLYDKGGEGIKNGMWIELSPTFEYYSQVIYYGEYEKGKKVGNWNTCFIEKDLFASFNQKQIGLGSYDKDGNGMKIGIWIEISDGFWDNSQITYKGQYKNGIKVGRWNTYWIWDKQNKQIGGGSYDDSGDGIKIGRWIELRDGFYNLSQVIYIGEYNKGRKVSRWDILYSEYGKEDFEQIGGGTYDEEGMKIGSWIELCDNFGNGSLQSQIIYSGQYQNGQKVGQWFENKINNKGCGMRYDQD